MQVNVSQAEDFFFEAMLAGYVAGAAKKKVLDEPGYVKIEYQRGEFHLVDRYLSSLGRNYSGGTTTIWVNGSPVWLMSYMGWYDPRAIPVLKAALRRSYEKRDFNGGRGPDSFSLSGLSYTNHVNNWQFKNFDGRESVPDNKAEQSLGYHRYHGHILIEPA